MMPCLMQSVLEECHGVELKVLYTLNNDEGNCDASSSDASYEEDEVGVSVGRKVKLLRKTAPRRSLGYADQIPTRCNSPAFGEGCSLATTPIRARCSRRRFYCSTPASSASSYTTPSDALYSSSTDSDSDSQYSDYFASGNL
eukprot:TRINITY_DN52190_c0_g1_i1.p1 TRINITY_DN52190_c0_g1~~TRINITY_DN52190_c0_g1_i1.p1  ORF type:complete len:142 (+),score=39.11 TRINITY_DN52190_c0_g1_i1:420-845(+)